MCFASGGASGSRSKTRARSPAPFRKSLRDGLSTGWFVPSGLRCASPHAWLQPCAPLATPGSEAAGERRKSTELGPEAGLARWHGENVKEGRCHLPKTRWHGTRWKSVPPACHSSPNHHPSGDPAFDSGTSNQNLFCPIPVGTEAE